MNAKFDVTDFINVAPDMFTQEYYNLKAKDGRYYIYVKKEDYLVMLYDLVDRFRHVIACLDSFDYSMRNLFKGNVDDYRNDTWALSRDYITGRACTYYIVLSALHSRFSEYLKPCDLEVLNNITDAMCRREAIENL